MSKKEKKLLNKAAAKKRREEFKKRKKWKEMTFWERFWSILEILFNA